ncbi:hypothetical protein GQ651_11960 [Alphaproteobacteria bacterium GH1-50]|uniref:Uncharacterized protein n=1 Tax=Kangsaoukella pontilimi TaxID=2691042 RepID=A0A7C9IIW6_9RHOB|nr:hypothetical protein [Kangsaoukella pontilimi]MXQ08562.1 hypothetical protein [Kangsaoukella pontilimi]
MTRLPAFAALVGAIWCLPGLAVGEDGVTLLIDRRAGEVSFYLSLPAEDLPAVMGEGAGEMLGPDGTVDIDALYDGTFDTADRLFAGSALRVNGEEVQVEALSMMLHDPKFLPPFADPYDGQVSIAVCTSPETVRGMELAELRAYLGYFAWRVDGLGPLELSFPRTGRDPVEVTLRVFDDFEPAGERVVFLEDGGTISVPVAATFAPGGSKIGTGAAIGALALIVAFTFSYMSRARRRRHAGQSQG